MSFPAAFGPSPAFASISREDSVRNPFGPRNSVVFGQTVPMVTAQPPQFGQVALDPNAQFRSLFGPSFTKLNEAMHALKPIFEHVVLGGQQLPAQTFYLQLMLNELDIQAKFVRSAIQHSAIKGGDLEVMATNEYNSRIQELYNYVTRSVYDLLVQREKMLKAAGQGFDAVTLTSMHESLKVLKTAHQLFICAPDNSQHVQYSIQASLGKMRTNAGNVWNVFSEIIFKGQLLPSAIIKLNHEQDQFEREASAVRGIIQKNAALASDLSRMTAGEYVNLVQGLYQAVVQGTMNHLNTPLIADERSKPYYQMTATLANGVAARLQTMRLEVTQ